MFIQGSGNWTQYRTLQPSIEVDFHRNDLGKRDIPYGVAMDKIRDEVLESLKSAYNEGKGYVLLIHGHSTSRPGKTTTRSVIRALMRSKEATPYIIRNKCIQHQSVFVAAIRANKS